MCDVSCDVVSTRLANPVDGGGHVAKVRRRKRPDEFLTVREVRVAVRIAQKLWKTLPNGGRNERKDVAKV